MISTTSNEFNPFEENKAQVAFANQAAANVSSSDVITSRFPFYVRDRLPSHVLENYELYVKFIESYFEWLGISNGIDKIPYLMDLNNISSDLLIHHKELLANFFPENTQLNWSDPSLSEIDLRKFLSFVRQFYLTKGTEESIRFLLSSLYNLESSIIDFAYPKLSMCILSDSIWVPGASLEGGGARIDTDALGNTYPGYWSDSRTLLSGGVRFRDKYYQEFSYAITATVPNVPDSGANFFILNSVKDIAHPAGFRLFNNVGPETYTPTPPGTIDTGYSESPLIGHYLAYQFDTIRNPRDPFDGSCTTAQAGWDWFPCGFNPWTLNPLGITSSINCNTPVHNPNGYPIGYTAGSTVQNKSGYTFDMDTYNTANDRGYTLWVVYNHPNVWSVGPTSGTPFGDMKLGWLISLIPDITKNVNSSPNDPVEPGITACTLAT